MSVIERLKQMPAHRATLEEYLNQHGPTAPTKKPVMVPAEIFDVLCMAALAGLEATEGSAEGESD